MRHKRYNPHLPSERQRIDQCHCPHRLPVQPLSPYRFLLKFKCNFSDYSRAKLPALMMNISAMNEWIEAFEKNGFYEWPNFLDQSSAQAIRLEIENLEAQERFKQAGIGKDANAHINNSQRSDFIHWIDHRHPNQAASVFIEKLQELITQLNRNFYLGIRDFECHYTHYPPGSFYKRHVDRHKSGSSRIVSFVFYLNQEWIDTDGGQLCIYAESQTVATINPQMGTLALFLSEKEHEVLVTQRDRMSITGWMLNEKIL